MEDVRTRVREINARLQVLLQDGRDNKAQQDDKQQQLAAFDTQEGQQMNKLELTSRDTAAAWKWIQENMESFEKTVYGPPLVSCSLKDQRYANVVEAGLRMQDFLAITVQTKADHKKLSEHLLGAMGLADITIRKNNDESLPGHPSVSRNDMQNLGLDGWASDFVDGPIPVLSMLCYSAKINTTAVGLVDSSEDQHNRIVGNSMLRAWNTGRTASRVTRRAEYGPGATSTSTNTIKPAQYWTDQPVSSTAKMKVERELEVLKATFEGMKAENTPLKSELETLRSLLDESNEEIVSLTS